MSTTKPAPQPSPFTGQESHMDSKKPYTAQNYRAYLIKKTCLSPADEKRECRRRGLRCEMSLIRNTPQNDTRPPEIPAHCLNVSDNGLYGIVPIGFGVGMGQEYTFQLALPECGPEPGSNQTISQRGRIARTELLIDDRGEAKSVGVGVELFGPRSGFIQMPGRL